MSAGQQGQWSVLETCQVPCVAVADNRLPQNRCPQQILGPLSQNTLVHCHSNCTRQLEAACRSNLWRCLIQKICRNDQSARYGVCGNITYVKGVASWARPCMAPAFPAMLSTNMPMVMRLGKACGLMMTSGCIPLSLNGMSIAGHFWEQTPFCPCRDENLSPITGERGILSVI